MYKKGGFVACFVPFVVCFSLEIEYNIKTYLFSYRNMNYSFNNKLI